MYIDRDEAIKRIRSALKRKTGKTWSVTGGRGTAWGWITVQAPPKRRLCHDQNPDWTGFDDIPTCIRKTGKPPWIERKPKDGEKGWYTSDAEAGQLGRAFKLDRRAHFQGLHISPDETEFYVKRAEA